MAAWKSATEMGKSLTPAKLSHLERQTRDLRASSATAARKQGSRQLDASRPPWHIRNLAGMIVGGGFSVLLLLGVLVVNVVNQGVVPSSQTTEVKDLVGVVDRLIDVIDDQREERQQIQAEEQSGQQEQVTKAGMIFWAIMAGVFLLLSAQFAPPWGLGIGLMMIITVVGIWSGYIYF